MRTTTFGILALVASVATAQSAEWEGTWSSSGTTCKPAGTDPASVVLGSDRIVAQGRECTVRVERGRAGDDLLVETCRGGGKVLPAFEVVGVHDGRLVVTTPFGGPQRTFERCR